MASVGTIKSVSGSADWEYQDSVQVVYEVQYDSTQTNFYTALVAAQSATGIPVPARRTKYSGTSLVNIYAQTIAGSPVSGKAQTMWQWTVTFSPPPEGELTGFEFDNPLDRPAIYNVDYMDQEVPISVAENVEELAHGDGQGGTRSAGTSGLIVNGAGEESDDPFMRTKRVEVLVIQKNFPTLSSITNRNRTFKDTTNSDTVQGYGPRELEYMLTQSVGVQKENGITFWPGITTIKADSTDLIVQNAGRKHWDGAKIVDVPDGDGNGYVAPVALKRDGTLAAGSTPENITYRYLTPSTYASLFD